MRVIPATSADWPRIWPLWHRVVAAGETIMWAPDTDEPTARALWMSPTSAEVFIAEDDGEVVGTAMLKPNQPGLGDHVANAAFMVDPDHTGQGIGRLLAEYVVGRARQLGYHGMQFNAVVSSNVGAVRLWKRLGFEIAGTIPNGFRHATLGPVDIHVMYRAL
ncbi:MAG: GNAT family N-acetyltransferase [Actinomycetota bacterium]|nr:GNAT family N-acetyltransferase [Actinomycetota bacterium]